MTLTASTLAELRERLNELHARIPDNTPVPWDLVFDNGGHPAELVLTILTGTVGCTVTPTIQV